MKQEKKLSIFIPFYNEENNLQETVKIVERAAPKHLDDFEVILVDDASTDTSPGIARALQNEKIKVVHLERNSGFGIAFLTGFKQSRFPFALYLCADGDVTEKELEELFIRWNGSSNQIQHCLNMSSRSFLRFFLSELYTRLLSLITHRKLKYFNGFNILSTSNKEKLVIRDFGFSSQAYLLLHALKNNVETTEYGIQCKFNDAQSKSISVKNIFKTLHFLCFTVWNN